MWSDDSVQSPDAASGSVLDARIRVVHGAYGLDIEVHADPGEVVAVMGPSGAGKSTMFEAIAGFVPLTDGEVRLDGRTLDAGSGPHVPSPVRGVVLMGQDARLFPHLSARENVAFGPRARGTSKARARADADAWLARVGLPGLGDRRPEQLSGGQQQRVALARALATGPRLLLLDEPLRALDPETATGIRHLLRDVLTATPTTTLVATHDAVDAASFADRLVVLESGRVTQSGTVHDVLRAPATPFVAVVAATLPLTSDDTAQSRGAHDAGWSVRVVHVASDETGLRVLARTPDGDEVVLHLPSDAHVAVGSTVSIA
ncbi:ATP-binding cassette domain-containing protein [Planctomonas sp. JC2975]|nr:ATP-binding cassette domain-containing protein [Planctomonas sp. JC2975]